MSKELKQMSKISFTLRLLKGIFEDIFATNLSPIKPTLEKIKDAIKTIPLVETALERFEELEKALKIIKEKRVDVNTLLSSRNYIEYNDLVCRWGNCLELTQENLTY